MASGMFMGYDQPQEPENANDVTADGIPDVSGAAAPVLPELFEDAGPGESSSQNESNQSMSGNGVVVMKTPHEHVTITNIETPTDIESPPELPSPVQPEQTVTPLNQFELANDPLSNPDGEVTYKTMSWWHAGLLMIAEIVSLGVLSLPAAVSKLGIGPGILVIVLLGVLATYSGYVIGQFKLRNPNVLSMADAGAMLAGNMGYWIGFVAALFSFIFIMGAHILTFSVAMNVLTEHNTCTIAWAVIGFIVSIILTLPRKLQKISYLSFASFVSIVSSVMVVLIAVSIKQPKPIFSHAQGIYKHYEFISTIHSVLVIVIAFMGNVAFFGFISELREPRDFPKALAMQQIFAIVFYAVIAALIYSAVGDDVPSPALGASTPLIQKVAYGLAMPTIIIAGVINAHIGCKQLYIQIWRRRNPGVITSRSFTALSSWYGIVVGEWVLALLLALAIPIFEQLLALVSAIFGCWFTYGVTGFLWIDLNRSVLENWWEHGIRPKKRKIALLALNLFMIALGMTTCITGIYVSAKTIGNDETKASAFSCEDNSRDITSQEP